MDDAQRSTKIIELGRKSVVSRKVARVINDASCYSAAESGAHTQLYFSRKAYPLHEPSTLLPVRGAYWLQLPFSSFFINQILDYE